MTQMSKILEREPRSGLDRFERGVVFRVARGTFLVMAALGVLALLLGGGALLVSAWRATIPLPAEPAAVAAPPALTAQRAEAWLQERAAQAQRGAALPVVDVAAPPAEPAPIDREAQAQRELGQLLDRLRALLPPPSFVWEDQYQEVCRVPSSYGCLQTERKRVQQGLFAQLKEALGALPDAEVLPTLRELCAALEQAPLPRRGAILPALLSLRRESWARYREAEAARSAQVAAARRRHEEALAAQEERSQHLRTLGLYGGGAGLLLLVLVSLFLSHFAIERHLRLLRQVSAGPEPSS